MTKDRARVLGASVVGAAWAYIVGLCFAATATTIIALLVLALVGSYWLYAGIVNAFSPFK